MKKGLVLLSLLGLLSLLSCEKNLQSVEGTVDIFLVEYYATGEGDILIDENSIRLMNDPVIPYSEIISYSPDNYTFEISDMAKNAIFEADPTVYGQAFAVVANDEVIYTGFFWPGFFSSMCFWVCIDPLTLNSGNTVSVNMGYPALPEHVFIPDKRNDKRLLRIFKRDGKLKK